MTTRITVDLSPDMYKCLGGLEKSTGAQSKAAVVRHALTLYETIQKRQADGYTLKLHRGEKEIEVIILC